MSMAAVSDLTAVSTSWPALSPFTLTSGRISTGSPGESAVLLFNISTPSSVTSRVRYARTAPSPLYPAPPTPVQSSGPRLTLNTSPKPNHLLQTAKSQTRLRDSRHLCFFSFFVIGGRNTVGRVSRLQCPLHVLTTVQPLLILACFSRRQHRGSSLGCDAGVLSVPIALVQILPGCFDGCRGRRKGFEGVLRSSFMFRLGQSRWTNP